jgi:hypothetical protein
LVIEPFHSRGPRVLLRDKPEVRRQLAGSLEPTPIDDLRRQHHRSLQGDAAETLQPRNRGGEGRRERHLFDLTIELVAPLQFVGEQRVILSKHQAIRRGQRRRLTR